MNLRYRIWWEAKKRAKQGDPDNILAPIRRGQPWADTIKLTPEPGNDTDLTSGLMAMVLGLSPSDGLGETNDVSVGEVTFVGGTYFIPVALNATQTAAMPDDDDGDERLELIWELRHNAGAGFTDLTAGRVFVLGKVAND